MSSRLLFIALPVLPVLFLVALPGLSEDATRGPEQDGLPTLFMHLGEIPSGGEMDAVRALRDVVVHIDEKHPDLLRSSIYFELMWGDRATVAYLAEHADGAALLETMTRFVGDGEWQRLITEFEALTTHDEVSMLLPLGGRRAPESSRVRTWRTARATLGSFAAASQASRAVAEHVNASHADVSMQVYVQEMGDFGVLHWFTDFADVAAYADVRARLVRDEEYLALVDDAHAAFVEGSVRTLVLQLF